MGMSAFRFVASRRLQFLPADLGPFACPLASLLLLGALLLGARPAIAAEIMVSAGDNTLQNAINSASAGDTLLLADGFYTNGGTSTPTGNDIEITKALTIRAASKAANPTISNELRVQASPV
ncbi:MAG: hypothetical protein R3200_14555, partial [Xanthomonadales bacterium]|nr:hypothetical protein [Xanthomonadales bacterium]